MESAVTQLYPWLVSAVMLIAGIGIPVMAALNSGLGGHLQSPQLAGMILLAVALIAAILVNVLFTEATLSIRKLGLVPWQYYLGGFFVAFYVLTITWAAPKIGVGNAVFFVLLGQLISTAIIDHLGLFNAIQTPVTTERVIGIALMAVGVFLARSGV